MKKQEDQLSDLNEINLQQNMAQLRKNRSYASVSAGIFTGVIGLNGVQGTIFYVFLFFIVSLCLNIKMKFKVNKYFQYSTDVNTSGIGKDVTLYILIWVISNNIVYFL